MTRLLLSMILVLGLASCRSQPEPAGPRTLLLDRTAVRALRDFIHAGYALRRLRDDPQQVTSVDALEAELQASREVLREALVDAGADPAQVTDDAALLEAVGEAVRSGGRYGIVFTPQRESFALVRIRANERNRNVVLFGEPFRYDVLVHDETLVLDYPQWLAAQVAPAAPIRQPATYSSEGTVRIDREAIQQIGSQAFLPRVDVLRAARDAMRDDRQALRLATPEGLPELLGLVKDALRWRALEPLWVGVQARGRDEQLERFVEDYAARAELRAAAELRELLRLRPPGDERALSDDERTLVHELGALSAIAHGDPLGHTADVVALAAAGLGGSAPPMIAARRLLGELAAALRDAPPGAEADALALAALSRAEASRLQALARGLHARRLVDLPR